LNGYYNFQDEANSTEDGEVLTGPWIWTYLWEPTVADGKFALRETKDTISQLSASKDEEDDD
jgi:hypothetical protein